jgi:beta-glucosidase
LVGAPAGLHDARTALGAPALAAPALAVIGPNAAAARTLGGGSARVFPPYTVSPLEGRQAALPPSCEIGIASARWPVSRIPVASAPWLHRPGGGGPGVEVRFLTGDGTEVDTEQRPGCSFNGPAGQDITVTIALPGRAFAHWKVAAHG